MSKESRERRAEYDFRGGVRGKYATHYREQGNVVVLDAPAAEDIAAWAPLIGFEWSGSERQVAPDTWVRPCSAYRGFEHFAGVVAEEELGRCRDVGHWLHIVGSRNDDLSASEKINSFLLTLWIVRPTATHVPFRFEETESGTKPFARHLGRFQWIKGEVREDVRDIDLVRVSRLLPELRGAYAQRKRLCNALVLTLHGCHAKSWQVALVCFAAAAEAILTYSREPRIAERLATSYAKLVSKSGPAARKAQEQFKALYAVRSHIMHGRSSELRDATRNLRTVAAFSSLLRRLWHAVLECPQLRQRLDGDDNQRREVLRGL
ncbi:MAG: hypothetical protein HYS37_05645 [Candidatus Rokubacteria bacterium]|nr:hypothetical protein [Candidatus Rokubacteria bacterium]